MKQLVFALMVMPGIVAGNPVDEVIAAVYLTLAPGKVLLDLHLAPGARVAQSVLSAIDVNGDQSIGQDEAQAYARTVLDQSSLTVDSEAAPWALVAVNGPDYELMSIDNDTFTLTAIAPRTDTAGAQELRYSTTFQPAKMLWIANFFATQ